MKGVNRTVDRWLNLRSYTLLSLSLLLVLPNQAFAATIKKTASLSIDFEPSPSAVSASQGWASAGEINWALGPFGKSPGFRQQGSGLKIPLSPGDNNADVFNPREGSIRFRFRPDWNSGEGPGHWASFVSVGVWTPDPSEIGYWALGTNPTGDQLNFSGQEVGKGKTFFRIPIQFKAKRWYDILLVYTAASTRIFIDGVEHGPGAGVVVRPSDAVLAEYGLQIGNNHHGNQPIEGMIDRLEIFRNPKTSFVQRKENFALSASAETNPIRVILNWPKQSVQQAVVQRREFGRPQSTWEFLSTVQGITQFVDDSSSLRLGGKYEYRVGQGRCAVSIGVQPVLENRGRVLLVIAANIVDDIQSSLEIFTSDLHGDGWSVERVSVPKHEPRRRSRYLRQIRELKSKITAFHRQSPTTQNVVLLVGNVPIPYSGFRAEDGHVKKGDDHRGAWPCDAYYGDIDGVWTDERVSHHNQTSRSNSNRPGDGRFDQDFLPSALELAVSRIDFSNLPSITGKTLPGRPIYQREIEVGLLRRYFAKNHAYRMGALSFSKRAVFKSYLPRNLWRNMDDNAFRSAAALFGSEANALSEEDCFLSSKPVQWAFFAGFGGRSSVASGRYRTEFMNRPEFGPQAAFLMLYASWSADWNLRDSFTKSLLVKPQTGLAAMSSLHGKWQLSSLALGEPLARAFIETSEEVDRGNKVARSLSILGDATLRMQVVSPVEGLLGSSVEEGVSLVWEARNASAEDLGTVIYRSARASGPFHRISGDAPIPGSSYIDPSANGREAYYMVRRAALTRSPAGAYVNLSQGRFWNR